MSNFCCVSCRVRVPKNDQSWLFSLLKPEKSTMYVTVLLGAELSTRQRITKAAFFYSVNLKIVRYMSHFCCVPDRVRDKEWSKLTNFTVKTWSEIYDVCHIFVACRIKYARRITNIAVFYSANQENVRCLSDFRCVPDRVRDKGCLKLPDFSLCKPKKCTIYVTFLLRAE